jgi:hypothetical protein
MERERRRRASIMLGGEEDRVEEPVVAAPAPAPSTEEKIKLSSYSANGSLLGAASPAPAVCRSLSLPLLERESLS